MIPNVVEIASPGLYLSKSRGFLSIKDETGTQNKLPLDEIGVLVITSPKATLSTSLMNTLAERGIIAMLCDTKHRPSSYIYPFRPHEEVSGRLMDQIGAGKPLKKRLWQSLIIAKIVHQAFVLESLKKNQVVRMKKLAATVTSGDKENKEAQAARIYWQELMGTDFRRIPRGTGANNLLDFGYGIFRSAILRAIAGVGLNPSLGLNHISRRNPFCLADDLMEPFRPIVDYAVYQLVQKEKTNLVPPIKSYLAALLAQPVQTSHGKSPLGRAMNIVTQSLVRSFESQNQIMEIPMFPDSFSTDMQKLWDTTDFS